MAQAEGYGDEVCGQHGRQSLRNVVDRRFRLTACLAITQWPMNATTTPQASRIHSPPRIHPHRFQLSQHPATNRGMGISLPQMPHPPFPARANPQPGTRRRRPPLVTLSFVILSTPLASTHLAAQWVKYPTAGVPRKADGKVDMSAPSPRMVNGKPDLSGIWTTAEPNGRRKASPGDRQTSTDAGNITASRQMANIGVDLPGGLPYQPWLVPIVKERTANLAKDDPHIKCWPDNFLRAYGLPHLLKFIDTPNLLVMLNEMNAGYRQVFTDARPLPEDPNPSLQGYSSAKWSGDTLVIDTIGLRDDTWIDWNGSVLTQAAKVREQIRRPDFGHLEIQVTVDDPKAYTKPWTVTLKERIVVDAELIDEICLENERSLKHMK